MTELHVIDELDQEGIVLSLSLSEQRALRCVDKWLGLEWRGNGCVRVYSRGNVGTVVLSPKTAVRVRTKVPVGNLLSLAALAFATVPIPRAAGESLIDSAEPVVNVLSVLFVTELERLLGNGLRQDYLLVADELPFIRGRVRFEQVHAWTRPGLVPCDYADFLPDIPENRVLRCALEVLNSSRLLPGLRPRVQQLLPSFGSVSLVRPSRRLVASYRYTRLTEHYRPALELSRLLIEQVGIESELGDLVAPAYFLPMEEIFEQAITNFLRSHIPNVHSQKGRSHTSIHGDLERSLSFVADIVVGSPAQLVIDTKYTAAEVRNQNGGWSFHNAHLYQVAFYALSLCAPAMLYIRERAGTWT